MNYYKWLNKNTSSLRDKRVVVSGGTGGIGKELCLFLAKLEADITLLVRTLSKGTELRDSIISSYPNANVDILLTDLLDINSVRSTITDIKKYNGIDILIMNAGIYNIPIEKTSTGYNNVFQVNFISPYYMIKELLPELRKRENSSVVAVSSIAHNYSKVDENDIDFSTRKKPSKIYGNSKRFLTFALHELFANEDKVNLSIVHPGLTLTNMTNHYPKAINWLVKIGINIFMPNPKSASLNLLKGIFSPTSYHEWIGPKICNIWGPPKKKKLKTCHFNESRKIYNTAENISNLLKY